MTTAIQKTTPLPVANMQDLSVTGELIFQSKMFGVSNPAEGFVIAGMCHQANISYMEFMEKYHFFNGRISMRADAMLSNLLEENGEYKIIKRTAEEAEIWCKYGKAEGSFSLSWEEAKEEPFVYKGGPKTQMAELEKPFEKRTLKDKYKTPRSRKQMLWARVVSDGVRAVCPKAVQGKYTPEEVDDFDQPAEKNITPSEPQEISQDDLNARMAQQQKSQFSQPKQPVQDSQPAQNQQPIDVPAKEVPEPDFSKSKSDVNPEVCPIQGQAFGKRWDSMETSWLTKAMGLQNPEMTQLHFNCIKTILQQREMNNA